MTLATQINRMTVPQEFTRLCNALLIAEHGDDFLPIDDDAPDGGNDGYLKSERRMFAMHCFKRIQNQGIRTEIQRKAVSDLRKAIALKADGIWEIEAWTFVTNYQIPNEIGERLKTLGHQNGIDVSWRGEGHLAAMILRHRGVLRQFPDLEINEFSTTLDRLSKQVDSLATEPSPVIGIPSTPAEEQRLVALQPDHWEYRLFAGILFRRLNDLEHEWHDFNLGLSGDQSTSIGSPKEASDYLSQQFGRITNYIEDLDRLLASESQTGAFGRDGHPGDQAAIRHRADRIADTYEKILDWGHEIRSMRPPPEFERLFALAADHASHPATQIRDFIVRLHRQIEQLPELLAIRRNHRTTEPLVLEVTLDLEPPPGWGKDIRREAKRLKWRSRLRRLFGL